MNRMWRWDVRNILVLIFWFWWSCCNYLAGECPGLWQPSTRVFEGRWASDQWFTVKSSWTKVVSFVIICNFSVSLRVFQDKHPKKVPLITTLFMVYYFMLNYFRKKDTDILKFSLFPWSFDLAFQMLLYYVKQHPRRCFLYLISSLYCLNQIVTN